MKLPEAGRRARPTATSASPIAAASVSMWAASESSATELASSPTTTSTAMKPRLIASAIHSHRGSDGLAHAVGVAVVVGHAPERTPCPS